MDLDEAGEDAGVLEEGQEKPDVIAAIEEAERVRGLCLVLLAPDPGQTIVELVQKASEITSSIEQLDGGPTSVESLAGEYAEGCARVKRLLLSQLSHLVLNNPPQNNISTYGMRQDIANAQMEIALLTEELRALEPQ